MASQDHTYDQQVAIGITSGLLALTTFVVYLRLYIRCILKARVPGWDDLSTFIAWVMALGASMTTYVEIYSGLGRHIEDTSPDQLRRFNACRLAAIQLYVVGLTSVKISFLAQYYRTFDDRTIRRVCMCVAFFCTLWMIVQAIIHSFSCIPIQFLFPVMSNVCISSEGIWSAIAMINVLTDIIIFCIPLKPLWRMPLLKRQKYPLIAIFCFGLIICGISVVRIPALRHTAASTDHTSTYAAVALLSLAELELAIVCTSLPVLRPMFARFVPGVSPPDPSPTPSGTGSCFRRPKRNKCEAKSHDKSLLNTNNSGTTMTTNRSIFRSVTTRDDDRDDERPVLLLGTEARPMETKAGQQDEKKSESPKIVELHHHKREEESRLNTPIDFFHRPSVSPNKEIKKAAAIVPRDLRKDTSPIDDSSKASTLSAFIRTSSQRSTRKPLTTPITPLSAHPYGNETNGQFSTRTSSSLLRSQNQQSDDSNSPDDLCPTCNSNVDAVTLDSSSMLSSGLLLNQARSPRQQLPDLSPRDDQAKDTGTHTLLSRVQRTDSSPESSRPPSTQTQTSEDDRVVVVEVARQGTIARARERAMQAIADKTYGHVGEVHQGRARVVQVDPSQRRQAAIGLEEVMGLDFEQIPRCPVGITQGRKEATRAVDEKSTNLTPSPPSKSRQMTDMELTSNQRRKDGVHHENDAKETVAASETSRWKVNDAEDQIEAIPSAAQKRAAATSWLRLSTDFSL